MTRLAERSVAHPSVEFPEPLRTPLASINGVWVKLEGKQQTGSVKYRMVHAKLRAALENGRIERATTLTEVTSGSTGVALAFLGKLLGMGVELHVYESACLVKCDRMLSYGARLVRHPAGVPVAELLQQVVRKVERGSHWHLGQYDRASTGRAYEGLARETAEQLREKGCAPTFFVCPVGTGGLIQGVGSHLRSAFPGIRVIAAEPDLGAVIDGMRNTDQVHMGEEDPYDRQFPDLRVTVPPPLREIHHDRVPLGQSATAVYDLVRFGGWEGAVMVAPD
jgi:cysteine synthase A